MQNRFDVDTFVSHYLAALVFTDTGEEDQPSADLPFHAECKARARAECEAFLWRVYPYLDHAARAQEIGRDPLYQRAAHDFWMPRNGHGVGFWESACWPVSGEILTKIAVSFGAVDVYQTDCGCIDTM